MKQSIKVARPNRNAQSKRFHISLQPAPAWAAILGLIIFSALCILANAGSILRLTFPVASLAVGAFLYQRYPIIYISFTWWIWFLSPFVRRLIDQQSGWVDPSPVLLAPPLVTFVTFLTFIRYLPKSYHLGGLPFILSFIGVFYGFFIGLINNSIQSVLLNLLGWLTPILFGFHLFIRWRDYPLLKQNIQRTFLWGVLITGSYGIWQYLVAPEWDRFWLINTDIATFGSPEPFGIRVFSTMNSPQPFAAFIMAGLILLFSSQSSWRFVAAGTGYLSFLLSLARSAWFGWLVGVLVFMSSLKPRLQMRLMLTILFMAILVIPLTNIEPFSEVIHSRLETFSNTQKDTSFAARTEAYSVAMGLAFSEFIGKGLGNVINIAELGSNDSGLLSILFSLGWLGTIPYMGGILLIFFSLFKASEGRFDSFFSASRAIALAIFAQIGLNSVLVSIFGVLLWGFIGISMAGIKYYAEQNKNSGVRIQNPEFN